MNRRRTKLDSQRCFGAVAAVCLAALSPSTAHAFLFEEHANIGRYAEEKLSKDARDTLNGMWKQILMDASLSARLCSVAEKPWTHDRHWDCVDFGALPATAGDHSCSPAEMWSTATQAGWFKDVYSSAAETEWLLREPKATQDSMVNVWHQSNLILMRLDQDYLSRAENNNVHFLLAREPGEDLNGFLRYASSAGAPLNATAAYSIFHLAALDAAAEYAKLPKDAKDASARARFALSAEAFALHFLEDSFAAGHFAGLDPHVAEGVAERAGTHDYYCEHGLEARLWDETTSYAAHGDGFQTDPNSSRNPSDLEMAGQAVRTSLEQVLAVAGGGLLDTGKVLPGSEALADLDVCSAVNVTEAQSRAVARATEVLDPVLRQTPQSFLANAGVPHFRNELGLVLRTSGAARLAGAWGGDYDPHANNGLPRFQNAVQIGLGLGGGFAGMTTQATDGIFYVEGDFIGYGPETYVRGACTHSSGRGDGCLSLDFAPTVLRKATA